MNDTSTVAAISTAKGMGGIGVIRISGENAIEIANKVFVPFNKSCNILSMKGYTAKYGKVVKDGRVIDEAVLLVFVLLIVIREKMLLKFLVMEDCSQQEKF